MWSILKFVESNFEKEISEPIKKEKEKCVVCMCRYQHKLWAIKNCKEKKKKCVLRLYCEMWVHVKLAINLQQSNCVYVFDSFFGLANWDKKMEFAKNQQNEIWTMYTRIIYILNTTN